MRNKVEHTGGAIGDVDVEIEAISGNG